MSRHSLTNKFAFVSLLTGAVLVAAIQSSNAAAQPTAASPPVVAASYLCSAIIAYTPSAGQSELYQKDFVLQSGGTFVDDFSTATREHVFTAKAIPLGTAVRIEVDYFSDVSTFQAVDVATSLTILGNERGESTSGKFKSFNSASGNYTMTYALKCQEN